MRWFDPEKLAAGRVVDRVLRKVFPSVLPVADQALFTPRDAKKIVVFEFYCLGDVVMATPALRALRKRFPESEITLVGTPPSGDMARNLPWVDRILPFRRPWVSEGRALSVVIAETVRFLLRLRRERFDLAVDLRGDFRNIVLMSLSGARMRIAFGITGGEYLLTGVVPYDDTYLKHQLEGNLEVVRFLGCDISENLPELAIDPESDRFAASLLAGLKAPVIGIHPGASRRNKRWETGKWIRLIDRLVGERGVSIILLHGSSHEDREIVADILRGVFRKDSVIPFCETIPRLIAMIGRLDLLVALDSFASHIASAVGTFFLTLIGPQRPELIRPYHYRGRVLSIREMPCRPCGSSCIYENHNRCLAEISEDQVWKEIGGMSGREDSVAGTTVRGYR